MESGGEHTPRKCFFITANTKCVEHDDSARPYCFMVYNTNAPKSEWIFQSPCKQNMLSWMSAISAAIAHVSGIPKTVDSKSASDSASEESNYSGSPISGRKKLDEEAVLLPRRLMRTSKASSPSVTPPINIFPAVTVHETGHGMPLSPSAPRIPAAHGMGDKKLFNPTWPQPNYKYPSIDHFDNNRGGNV